MQSLFVTTSDFSDMSYGGPQGSYRNYLLLKEYGEVDVYCIRRKTALRRILSVAEGYLPPRDVTDAWAIRKLYREKQYQVVFLDNSIQGIFARIFDIRRTKIVAFYHNCEHDYNRVHFGKQPSLRRFVARILTDRAERASTNLADLRVGFSRRDSDRVRELYGKGFECLLPLTLVDRYRAVDMVEDKRSCLLFGPVGTANIEGFEWFVKNVSPSLHGKTVVAGKGFEAYQRWESEKVSVMGYVDDIAALYAKAGCVAIPLFSGGGMKVKTAEAMMFGKTIFGTEEAFSGYEVEYGQIGGLCNDAESFINKINQYMDSTKPQFNAFSRNLYLSQYSVDASRDQFKEIMKRLNLA